MITGMCTDRDADTPPTGNRGTYMMRAALRATAMMDAGALAMDKAMEKAATRGMCTDPDADIPPTGNRGMCTTRAARTARWQAASPSTC